MLKKLLVIFLCFALSACVHLANQSSPGEIIKSPFDNRVYDSVVLDNDLQVVLVSDPDTKYSAAALSVDVGMGEDPKDFQGLAHFVEHMLFLGTKNYPSADGFDRFLNDNGGYSNALTSENTTYVFQVNHAAYPEAISRFSDFFKAPLFAEEYVLKERKSVDAEWLEKRSNLSSSIEQLERSMMGKHPSNYFGLGNFTSLQDRPNKKLHQAASDFFKQYYSANIMKLVLVSPEPIQQMKQMAVNYFQDIPNKQVQIQHVSQKMERKNIQQQVVHLKPKKEIDQLQVSFITDNRDESFELPSYLMNSNMPGTLTATLLDLGYIQSSYTENDSHKFCNYGTFDVVYGLTEKGKEHRQEIVGLTLNYIDLIRESGVHKEYIDEQQNLLDNQFLYSEKTSVFSYAMRLAQNLHYYPTTQVIQGDYLMAKFDQLEIYRGLNQLVPENMRVWYISDDEVAEQSIPYYEGQYRLSSFKLNDVKQWQEAAASIQLKLPSLNYFIPKKLELKKQKTTSQLPQLLLDEEDEFQVWHRPSFAFSHMPKGMMYFKLSPPASENKVRQQLMMSLWGDLYYAQHGSILDEAEFASLYGSVDGYDHLMIQLDGYTEYQPQLFQWILEDLNLNIDGATFEMTKQNLVQSLKMKQTQAPYAQAYQQLSTFSSLGSVSIASQLAALELITQNDLANFIQKALQKNQVSVLLLGNYDHADAKNIYQIVKKTYPKRDGIEVKHSDQLWKPQPDERFVIHRSFNGYGGAISSSRFDLNKAENAVAKAVLLSKAIEGYAYINLRTEAQLGYTVKVHSIDMGQYAGLELFVQTSSNDLLPAYQEIRHFQDKVVARLIETMTTTDFERLKRRVLSQLEAEPTSYLNEFSTYSSDWNDGNFKFDSREKFISKINQITKKDLQDFYLNLFHTTHSPEILMQFQGDMETKTKYFDVPGYQLIHVEDAKKQLKWQ